MKSGTSVTPFGQSGKVSAQVTGGSQPHRSPAQPDGLRSARCPLASPFGAHVAPHLQVLSPP